MASYKIKSKFVPREKLAKIIAGLKKKGKKVVFANGCYDLLHVGHLLYLQGARNTGDVLVVALNSDKSIQDLKGPERPLMPLAERAEMMSALHFVDYVTAFDERTAEATLELLKPSIQAKGTDYTKDSVPEAGLMRSLGGKVVITGDPKDHSTTELIEKIKKAYK